ncbi:MAG: DUF3006 family protein [Candidatus Subteraquimicrobiales bacterium]|nr:DUF3006 family protein [Candidatus Subteraquimicrobiales bacterium]
MAKTRIVQAVVDRIEDKEALIYLKGCPKPIFLPISLLPEGVREGSVLSFSLKFEKEKTKKGKEEISALIEKLSDEEKKEKS